MFVIYVKGGANWQEVSKLGRGKSDTNHPQIKQKLLSFLQPSIVLTSILFYAAGTGDVAGHHHVTRVTIHQVTQVTVDHTKSHQARVLHSAPKMTLWPFFLQQGFGHRLKHNILQDNASSLPSAHGSNWTSPFFTILITFQLKKGCRFQSSLGRAK